MRVLYSLISLFVVIGVLSQMRSFFSTNILKLLHFLWLCIAIIFDHMTGGAADEHDFLDPKDFIRSRSDKAARCIDNFVYSKESIAFRASLGQSASAFPRIIRIMTVGEGSYELDLATGRFAVQSTQRRQFRLDRSAIDAMDELAEKGNGRDPMLYAWFTVLRAKHAMLCESSWLFHDSFNHHL